MTIAQELKAALEQVAALKTSEAGLVESLTSYKAKIDDLEAKIASDAIKAQTDLEAAKAGLVAAQAAHTKAESEKAAIALELEAAKCKLTMAPFKDAESMGIAALKEGVPAGAPESAQGDVVALVDAARGTPEFMALYMANKATYDKQWAEQNNK